MEDKKKYVLEGIFVQFERANKNNGRIYSIDNYLPDLKKYTRRVKIKNILNDKAGEI